MMYDICVDRYMKWEISDNFTTTWARITLQKLCFCVGWFGGWRHWVYPKDSKSTSFNRSGVFGWQHHEVVSEVDSAKDSQKFVGNKTKSKKFPEKVGIWLWSPHERRENSRYRSSKVTYVLHLFDCGILIIDIKVSSYKIAHQGRQKPK